MFKTGAEFAKASKAFTLIEVLVVVAIIAVLSVISLVSVDRYQNKDDDVVIGVNLGQIRKIAAMIYTDEHSYASIYAADGDAGYSTLNDETHSILKTIEEAIHSVTDNYPRCYSEKGKYCVQAELLSGEYFCIDFAGFVGEMEGDYCADLNKKYSSP